MSLPPAPDGQVPRSPRFPTLTEAADAMGDDYCELPIYAAAGTSIVLDSAILHTRLDGDGHAPRRMLHVSHSRYGSCICNSA